MSRAQHVGCTGASASAAAALGWALADPALLAAAAASAQDAGVTYRPWERLMSAEASRTRVRPVATVRITLLGHFELAVDGVPLELADLRPQARQLLRLLALHAGEALHRERLSETLWPAQPPGPGIHRLQVAISSLRRALGDDARQSPLLEREGESYRFRVDASARVDVHQLRAATMRARAACRAGDIAGEVAGLQEALDLYSGDLLPEDGLLEWVVEARHQLRVEVASAATRLAELLAVQDPRTAVAAAERAVALDPYNDGAWQRLIALREELGDLAQARRARGSYEVVLRELGVETPGLAQVRGDPPRFRVSLGG